MALSKNLHNALIEFEASLQDTDPNKPYVTGAVRELRHSETDGLAAYEDKASETLQSLFSLLRMHDEVSVADAGEGGDELAVTSP